MNRVIYIIVPLLFTFHTYVSTDAVEDDYDEAEDYEEYINTNSTTNSSLVFTVGLKNITRNSGKNIKLICEVQVLDLNNSDVRFTWKQNEAPLDKNNRVKIKTFKLQEENRVRSVLRIANINVFDRSFFECIASNGIHKVRSEAYLFTNPDRHFDSPSFSTSKDISFSDPDSLGEMTTFLPNTVPKTEDNDYLSTISKTKTFSPPIEINLDFSDKVAHAPLFNNTEPFCQPYRGQQCKKYLSNVHVFVQPPFTQQEIESKLESAFLVVSQSNDISQSCNKFAVPSLCFSAFPICLHADKIESYQRKNSAEFKSLTVDDRNRFKSIRTNLTNSLRRICRDECILLENELCSKEYSIAKNHLVIGQILEFEECEYLPLDTDASSKNCLTLGVGDLKVNQDEKCYWDAGKLYKGTQDVSYTGKECLRWSHQFLFPLSDYPELAGHNYCRNPGLTEQEPFCYVEQNKRELCGISNCINVFGMYVIFIIVAISSFVILIIAFCYCRRRNKITRNLQNKDLPTASKNIYGNPGPSSPMEMNTLLPPHAPPQRNHNSNKNGLQTVPQYTYKEVRFLQELGEGAFGKVYKGELKAKTGKTFVAVKSLKENASAKTQADFQREIELISELKHPNIICLLGVVMKQEPMCMLFEFMSEGDLHEFLIANSPEESKCLTHDQFLHIAIQIAQGMEYLSGNHYVHRDLAARNCLVSNDMVVKISDFGLSRDMYSCDYYRVQSKSLLPVRWMPPESILYGKFTTESDVWSYGVVLWEIYSYGLQPYYGYNNQEVINMIRSRKLLPCPDACPSYCYSLMVECWAELASRRPNFSEIAHRLKVWKQSGTANGAYFKVPSAQPTPQKQPHTKSYELAQTICPTIDNQMSSFTWEREPKPTSSRLHDSQSSLNSRTSSLGNNTQSTGVSNEVRREHRRNRRNIDSLDRVNPKNTVVSSIGDNFETKLTQQVQL